jgi:hypothetical protein
MLVELLLAIAVTIMGFSLFFVFRHMRRFGK